MKDKHTPGPWIVRDDQIQDVHGNTITHITEGGYWNTTAGMIYEDMPWEANARLMAAAPELLEFVQYVAKGIPVWDDPDSLEESVYHLEKRAKRLVLKIEGNE